MSLPSTLFFLDKDKNVIGMSHVNVGWFMDAESLAKEITQSILNNKDVFEKTYIINVYDYELPKSYIVSAVDFPDFVKKMEAVIQLENRRYRTSKLIKR